MVITWCSACGGQEGTKPVDAPLQIVSPEGVVGCDLLCEAELELSVMQLCVTLPYQPLRGYCCLTLARFLHYHTRSFHTG
ncbi:uncharacterized [Lates japonicus]